MHTREHLLEHLDIEYSYKLARRMEQFRSNEVLGYRPAGSQAEFKTGEMLKKWKASGFPRLQKDAVTVDGWEFKRQSLRWRQKANAGNFSLEHIRQTLRLMALNLFPDLCGKRNGKGL